MISSNLDQQAKALRLAIIELSLATKTAHIGSALSCCDMLLAAYGGGLNISPENVHNPSRDRLVLSKGHCASALVCTLAMHGFYPMEKLFEVFNRDGGIQEHPNYQCIPGVENASGSLGHGLPLGLGMAMASNIIMESGITQTPYRVCVIMGDGECNEGSVWEAALLAAAQKVNNLCAIIDFNGWQGTGKSCDIMAIAPMAEKWRAFGWQAIECDGHDIHALKNMLSSFGKPNNPNKNITNDKPLAIIAHTIKGKGVSIMEDDNNWHYRIPNDEEMAIARKELSP